MSGYVRALAASPTVLHLAASDRNPSHLEDGTEDRQTDLCSSCTRVGCDEKPRRAAQVMSFLRRGRADIGEALSLSLSRGACWVGSGIWAGWLPHVSLGGCFGHVHLKADPEAERGAFISPVEL